MTFISEGGGRTVTNGMVYDVRKVYQVVANVVLDEVHSMYGSGEVHKTSRVVTEQRIYHIVAKTEELARALYHKNWGSEFQRHTLISISPLFTIDGEIRTGYA
jgi:hypothetical protein